MRRPPLEFHNLTHYRVEPLLEHAVRDLPHDGLRVEIKYCPRGSGRAISGTYYRMAPGHPDGKLIRLRVNRNNRYPVRIFFKTSEYFTKPDRRGGEIVCQRLRARSFKTPEHLILAIFLHEFSHYLDHMDGKNGRYKQTKADKFSYERLVKLGVLRD
jgi:hypothetical protein